MASQPFTSTEWQNIFNILDSDPEEYGFPERRFGSVLIGSFNIRKLGSTTRGRPETWDFLARICRQFDLLAIQEVMDNLNGLNKLMGKLGDEFDMIVSDKTGVFPGESGVGERLTFIYRRSVVERNEVVSDVTYDRSKVLDKLHQNIGPINEAIAVYDEKLAEFNAGTRSRKPYIKMPVFLTFIRQPYIVSFRIKNYPGTTPYEFMGVNAHLHFGKTILDRKVEFEALLEWIIERVKESGKAYYSNFILLGDLNLNYDNPKKDLPPIEKYMKDFNDNVGSNINVNFPFLDVHNGESTVYRTNAREGETYDQIGLFFRDVRFPTFLDNKFMNRDGLGPDYGVFNYVKLFRDALGLDSNTMTSSEKKAFYARFEHKVSDHMPIWFRLPLPTE